MRVPSAPEAGEIEITLGAEALTAEVTISADIGVVKSLDQTTQQVRGYASRRRPLAVESIPSSISTTRATCARSR